MSKTLVVSYLPNAQSVTKKVLDRFLKSAEGKTTIVHRDLLKAAPPAFNETSMTAYQLRGFMGQALSGPHAEAIKPFDALIEEISNVQNVVFAFPTHNWSEPGVVKTYIDAILQAGKLIQYDDKGQSHGVLTSHKALVIFASGGVYETGHPRQTIEHAFTFYLNAIGITDVTFAYIGGTLMGAEHTNKSVEKAATLAESFAGRIDQPAKASA